MDRGSLGTLGDTRTRGADAREENMTKSCEAKRRAGVQPPGGGKGKAAGPHQSGKGMGGGGGGVLEGTRQRVSQGAGTPPGRTDRRTRGRH